jgi:hypothetical protein
MRRQIISTHLLRVHRSLTLIHSPADFGGESPKSDEWAPAVLIIPTGGGLREPHLIALQDPRGRWDVETSACVMTDLHAVVCVEDLGDYTRHPAADVLVCRNEVTQDQMTRLVGDYPGCKIAVGRRAEGYLLWLDDGWMVDIDGPATFSATDPWLAIYGSVLHCWLSAGMPSSVLADSVVAAGHYRDAAPGRECHFHVAGRTNVHMVRRQSTAVTGRAA